ncbi:helix-turn-helix transcriptional regulator [Paenibacillus sp. HB172176]|uniref:helix-turn-helix transcriptional regulator n=1 Tax=Paenibacillus sp. HB172176 TaxID=2493690 RepID=UPI00143AD2E3|nr:helix-turn-helix transcriptional regulator [Paenibacillus sp. HB172176]
MQLVRIGYHHRHDANFRIHRPGGSGDYLLLLLKSPALFFFGNREVAAERDSFILYDKHVPQSYRALGSVFSNDWFHFQMNEEEIRFLETLDIPRNQLVQIGNARELSLLINQLCYEMYTGSRNRMDTLETSLKLFFLKLSNSIHEPGLNRGNSHYHKLSIFRSKIYNQPFLPWTIDCLANDLSMSRSSFQHLYKHYFGVSPVADVIASRIERAKYLLSTTDIAIARIAEMCGYNTETHFMRQFKKATGVTPTCFRLNSAHSRAPAP